MKLIIRNLDRSTTEAELTTLFQQYGSLQSCKLVLDEQTGGSKGFAFAVFSKPGDAKAAVKNMNNLQIGENKVRVKRAESKSAQSPQEEKS